MRILLVTHGFPPQDSAGGEILAYLLVKGLRKRGHQVTVYAREQDFSRPEGDTRHDSLDGAPVIRTVNNFTWQPRFRLYYESTLFDASFSAILDRWRPDLVHFHHVAGHGARLLLRAAERGVPSVLALHDFYFLCHRVHLMTPVGDRCPGPDGGERCVSCLEYLQAGEDARHRVRYMSSVLELPAAVLAPSPFLWRRYLGQFPTLGPRLRVLSPGVRIVKRSPLPHPGSAVLRTLYLGALVPHKGVHVLIGALRRLPPGLASLRVFGHVVPGAEGYAAELEAMAAGLPVEFRGPYGLDALPLALSAGDVVVIPSLCEETYSLVAHEAWGAGLPVVAARHGALGETVQEGSGALTFTPGDTDELAEVLWRLAVTPALRTALAAAAPTPKPIARYVGEIEALFEEVQNGQREAVV